VQSGLEIDFRDDGTLLCTPADWATFTLKLGAVHALQSLRQPEPDLTRVNAEKTYPCHRSPPAGNHAGGR